MQHYLAGRGGIPAEPNAKLMHAVFIVCRLIAIALEGTTKSKFKGSQPVNLSIDAPWPASPEDLLPYGISDSIAGLELWEEQPGGESIFGLAGAMVQFYQPFADAFFQQPDYDFILRRPLRQLGTAMDAYQSNTGNKTSASQFEHIAGAVTSFLGAHLMHNYSGHFINMLISQKRIAFPVFDRMWGIVRSRPPQDAIRGCIATLRDLCKLVIDPESGEPFLPPGESMDASDTIPGPVDEVEDALSHMFHVRSGGCLNPTCSSNREGIYTRLCSNCKIVRFCGVEVRMSISI